MRSPQRFSLLQPTPIAACLSSLLALSAVPALAATNHVVTSCDDSATAITTPGTLRYWVKNAASGDSIDLTGLTNVCNPSTITLAQGELAVTQSSLWIEGPNTATVTIHANNNSRIFKHTGTGILTVNYLTLRNGKYRAESAARGCIYSAGRVDLAGTTITGCLAEQSSGSDHTATARGGAIFAKANVFLYRYCSITGNRADASGDPSSAGAFGGGIYGGGPFFARYSTIAGNEARGVPGVGNGKGGGVLVTTGVTLHEATIANNRADLGGGLLQTTSGFATDIANSTISTNYASSGVGGIDLAAGGEVANSTIVFNTGSFGAAGLRVRSGGGPLELESSIIAGNVGLVPDIDFEGTTLTGADNFITSLNQPPPSGLVVGFGDPLLAPLGNHGGPTPMHAPLPGSPVIAMGNDTLGLTYDQRGPDFFRSDALIKVIWTDIGAYQVQLLNDDEIFASPFGPLPGG